jgi:hypothetical protein
LKFKQAGPHPGRRVFLVAVRRLLVQRALLKTQQGFPNPQAGPHRADVVGGGGEAEAREAFRAGVQVRFCLDRFPPTGDL